MAIKTSWTAGQVLTAVDLTDTFAARAALTGAVFTGNVVVTPASGGSLISIGAAASAQEAILFLKTGSNSRWGLYKNSVAESGANAGSDLAIFRFSDAGAPIEAALYLRRSDGAAFVPSVYTLTTASAANVHVLSDGNLLRSTSSAKYKADVQDATASEQDAVLDLRPVTYKSLSDADDSNQRFWGFIAEEVEQIDPRLVSHGADGEPEGVQYDRIIPALVGIIQRLEARVSALEAY